MDSPMVSVIMPVYNGERFLASALESVKSQQYQPLEIIVVDDGSTDGTAAVAAQFANQIRYVYQANQGAASARNRGIEAAQGEVFAFLDVDDTWVVGGLHRMVAHLAAHPEAAIVRGFIQLDFESPELEQQIRSQQVYSKQPYYFINLGSNLFRKTAFEKVGRFDLTLRTGEDMDWFFRAWEHQIEKVDVDEVFLIYQQHLSNLTRETNLIKSDLVTVFKRHLDRLRVSPVTGQSTPGFPSIAQYINGTLTSPV